MRLHQKHLFLKTVVIKTITFIILMNTNLTFAQEWKSLKSYQKETGNAVLSDGCWLKKEVVKFANEGSEKVFTFAFPQLKRVYFSNEIIIGKMLKTGTKNMVKESNVKYLNRFIKIYLKKLSKN